MEAPGHVPSVPSPKSGTGLGMPSQLLSTPVCPFRVRRYDTLNISGNLLVELCSVQPCNSMQHTIRKTSAFTFLFPRIQREDPLYVDDNTHIPDKISRPIVVGLRMLPPLV